jgi:acetyltransferase-like isoleucine patch superfamily enzyme/acyl carrier protein
MSIGNRFRLHSVGVQSHLVTGPRGRLEIGDDVSIDSGAAIAAHASVKIGQRVRIGPMVMILDTDFHDVDSREDGIPDGEPIVIGDHVQIGSGVTVLKGTTIGEGARIESGSVVSGRIPAGATAGGVPAQVRQAAVASITPASIEERVRRVVATTFNLVDLPSPTSAARDVDGWDSLGALKLLLELESEFGIVFDDADVPGLTSLPNVVAAVKRRTT